MSQPPDEIALLSDRGFTFAEAASTPTFSPFVKRLSERLLFYFFLRDDTAGDGPISAAAWVAPTDFPDDGLESLGVGFKIALGESYDLGDGFSSAMVTRATLLERHSRSLVEAVEEELDAPAVVTRRFAAYRLETSLFANVRELRKTPRGQYWDAAFELARLVALGQETQDALEAECRRSSQRLLDTEPAIAVAHHEHFGGDPGFLGSSIAGRLYAEALCPAGFD